MTSHESIFSHRTSVVRVAKCTMRAFMLASLVGAGVWLGRRPSRIHNGPYNVLSRPIRNELNKHALCRGISASDSEVPSGYTLIGLKRLDGDCFAVFKADDPGDVPAGGGGVADVSDPNGRLTERFAAIALPDGQWEF